jgi:hypothetical protein
MQGPPESPPVGEPLRSNAPSFLKQFCRFCVKQNRRSRNSGKRGSMVLRLNQHPNIEDLHHHSPEIVEVLRQLLASGAPAKADPRRNDFYELENGSQVFYIHISPVNGKVLLLGTWLKDEAPAAMAASQRAG